MARIFMKWILVEWVNRNKSFGVVKSSKVLGGMTINKLAVGKSVWIQNVTGNIEKAKVIITSDDRNYLLSRIPSIVDQLTIDGEDYTSASDQSEIVDSESDDEKARYSLPIKAHINNYEYKSNSNPSISKSAYLRPASRSIIESDINAIYKENNKPTKTNINEIDKIMSRYPIRQALSPIDINTPYSEPSTSKKTCCNCYIENGQPLQKSSNKANGVGSSETDVTEWNANNTVYYETSTSKSICLRSNSRRLISSNGNNELSQNYFNDTLGRYQNSKASTSRQVHNTYDNEVRCRSENIREHLSEMNINIHKPSTSKQIHSIQYNNENIKKSLNEATNSEIQSEIDVYYNGNAVNSEPSTSKSASTHLRSYNNIDQTQLMSFIDTISRYLNSELSSLTLSHPVQSTDTSHNEFDKYLQGSFNDIMSVSEPMREDLNDIDINTLFSEPLLINQTQINSVPICSKSNNLLTSSFNEIMNSCCPVKDVLYQIDLNTPNIEPSTSTQSSRYSIKSSGDSHNKNSEYLQNSYKNSINKCKISGPSGKIDKHTSNTEHLSSTQRSSNSIQSSNNYCNENYKPVPCSSNEAIKRPNQKVLHDFEPSTPTETCSSDDSIHNSDSSYNEGIKKIQRHFGSIPKYINKPSTSTKKTNSIPSSNNYCNLNNQPAQCSSNPIIGASGSINTQDSEPSTSTKTCNSLQSTNISGSNNEQSVQPSSKEIICPCHNDALLHFEPFINSKRKRKRKINIYSTRADSTDLIPLGLGVVKIQKSEYERINWKSYSHATRQLLKAVFPKTVLATHNLTGTNSRGFLHLPQKKRLHPPKVDDIVMTVAKVCNVDEKLVRGTITLACAQECRLSRYREKLELKKKNGEEVRSLYVKKKRSESTDEESTDSELELLLHNI